MGNQTGVQFSNEALRHFEKSYAFNSELKDERWGMVQLWSNKSTSQTVMVVSKHLHSDPSYLEFRNQMMLRHEHPNPNLLKFLGWSNSSEDGLCGHSRKFDLYIEHTNENLQKEINRRIQLREHFDENELWYIANSTISVGNYFQKNGIYHGDYRPTQILLAEHNFRGEIRLTDNGLIGFHRNNYIMTLSGGSKGYLSPELMAAYAVKDPNPAYDVYRADVYSLGMTLLHCVSLRDPEISYYNWTTSTVNQENIKHALNEARKRYSEELVNLISIMLEPTPSNRPDFLSLNVNQKSVAVPIAPAPVPEYVPAPVSFVPAPAPVPIYQPPPQYYAQPEPSIIDSVPFYRNEPLPQTQLRSSNIIERPLQQSFITSPPVSYVSGPSVRYENEPQLKRSMNYGAIAPSAYEQNYNFPTMAPPFYEQKQIIAPPVYGQNNNNLPNYYGAPQVGQAVPFSGANFERGAFYGKGPVPVSGGETFERRPFYGNGAPEYPATERFGTPAYPNRDFRPVEVPRGVPFNKYQGF